MSVGNIKLICKHEQLLLTIYPTLDFRLSFIGFVNLGSNVIADSLRILQHADSIQVPTEWQSAHSKTWKDILWTKKEFKVVNLYWCCIYINFMLRFSQFE
jgi:hypothetical protein